MPLWTNWFGKPQFESNSPAPVNQPKQADLFSPVPIWAYITTIVLTVLFTIDLVKGWPFLQHIFWWVVATGVIGFFVGLSELLNRYKSFRYIMSNGYSWLYMLINLMAACLTFVLFIRYEINLGPIGKYQIGRCLVAGLGAMAFLRSAFFIFKDSGGKSIEVGPAALLTVYLRACEMQFDQHVGWRNLEEVGPVMKGVDFVSASKDLPIIILRSMVVLTPDEQKTFSEEIARLIKDESTSNDVRNLSLGITISRYAGTRLLKEAVKQLQEIYKATKSEDRLADIPSL